MAHLETYSGGYTPSMPSPTTFGKRLRKARDQRGLSQADLETRSGVPAPMISHFETGVRGSASADTLVKLANALKVSIDYLLGRSDQMVPAGAEIEAVFRALKDASADHIAAFAAMARALAEAESKRGTKP